MAFSEAYIFYDATLDKSAYGDLYVVLYVLLVNVVY